MKVRTFRAASMQEALEQVRLTLGPSASVLHTRQVREGRMGWFSQRMVEVDASVDLELELSTKTVSGQSASLPINASGSTTDIIENSNVDFENDYLRNATTSITNGAIEDHPSSDNFDALISNHLQEILNQLIEVGFETRIAKRLLQTAISRCEAEHREDVWLVKGQTCQVVSECLKVTAPLNVNASSKPVIAMVGSTGVGKTTTLAKIAASYRFDQGCQIGLITLDTKRPGAVDQLLMYAELIDSRLEVVSATEQLLPALERLNDCDLVIIDTAGHSPNDPQQLADLHAALDQIQPTSVQLVVSATSSPDHAVASLRRFSLLNPTSLVLTKLDEAVALGAWFSVLKQFPIPVSYVTTGQEVPQDLVIPSQRRLASLILGHTNEQNCVVTK